MCVLVTFVHSRASASSRPRARQHSAVKHFEPHHTTLLPQCEHHSFFPHITLFCVYIISLLSPHRGSLLNTFSKSHTSLFVRTRGCEGDSNLAWTKQNLERIKNLSKDPLVHRFA